MPTVDSPRVSDGSCDVGYAGDADVQVGAKKRLPGRTKKLRDEKMDRTLAAAA